MEVMPGDLAAPRQPRRARPHDGLVWEAEPLGRKRRKGVAVRDGSDGCRRQAAGELGRGVLAGTATRHVRLGRETWRRRRRRGAPEGARHRCIRKPNAAAAWSAAEGGGGTLGAQSRGEKKLLPVPFFHAGERHDLSMRVLHVFVSSKGRDVAKNRGWPSTMRRLDGEHTSRACSTKRSDGARAAYGLLVDEFRKQTRPPFFGTLRKARGIK